jgi:hypothetical protein
VTWQRNRHESSQGPADAGSQAVSQATADVADSPKMHAACCLPTIADRKHSHEKSKSKRKTHTLISNFSLARGGTCCHVQ